VREKLEVLEEGNGELLAWVDPEEHREWVRRNKCLAMKDKVMSLNDAISKFVQNRDFVTFGGFGHVRVPMAAVYEIIRKKKRNLIVSGKTAVHDVDCLIAGGCVSKVEVAYSFGHELRGLSPASRRAVENGQVKVAAEWSNAALQWRFKAAASGLPWIPAYVMLGTDTLRYSAAKVVKEPFTGRPICLIPACFPDVAIIHVHRCDKYGNSQIEGSLVEDSEIARAAKRLIITTEEICSNEKIRDEPWQTSIPYFCVDAVVKVPFGGHPGNMPGRYYFDEEHISEYLRMTRTVEGTEQYISKYVYGVDDFREYLKLVGGIPKLEYLRELEKGKARFIYPWASGK
jgi:3-oxoacid CoA-transferase subunit A/glutaconate CoA-transferase subunit A